MGDSDGGNSAAGMRGENGGTVGGFNGGIWWG
jgi:hypothetical protein